MPAALVSSFGAHFLSASETKSFCSTDLKLCSCPLHRLNPNKILEVIRFLVMTTFLCHPVCEDTQADKESVMKFFLTLWHLGEFGDFRKKTA